MAHLSSVRLATAMVAVVVGACAGCGSSLPALPEDGEPGTYSASFHHDGVRRTAVVYVPESVASPAPMMLNFHGYGDRAEWFMETADLRPLADEEGFVLVYPQGSLLEGSSHWNSAAPSDDNKSDAEDFGFVTELIDTIAAAYTLDTDRVYATGYSNGGMMSFGLACYLGDRIAAVASVSGAMLDDIGVSCTPPHPMSVITLHGTGDTVLPYDGAEGMHSAQGVVDYWTGHNGITGEPTTSSAIGIESFVYEGGAAGTEVHHHRVEGGEHVWFALEDDGVDTNRLIWEFVSRFGLAGAL